MDREVALTTDRILIGRGDEADVRIDSVFVSRYHALILRDGKQDILLDLGSTNGLLVNGRRIVRRALRDRDLIQIGPTRVTYFTSLPAAAATNQPDPGETVCFARPGFPQEPDEEKTSVFAFGRTDTNAGH
jgi:pSer/pThr/pTyr-binding forkhead associated (FHA) protein